MTLENIDDQVYLLLQKFGRVSPLMLMRKFKINWQYAQKLCEKARLKQHNHAKSLAINILKM